MFDAAEYSSASECFAELDTISKRKRSRNKRRFSDEQIRSLEVMFESDTKLEPRKKAQLAKELGLQPRQIAIWFQNRRARWKSKQMEKDYSVLMANYNNLASQLESLKKENQSLSLQLEKMKKEDCENSREKNQSENREVCSSDGESDYRMIDFDVKNILDEENELMKMVEPAVDSSLTSSEDWGSDDLINQPSQWWDFWG